MDSLELKSVVKRLDNGICPCCSNKLNYISNQCIEGILEKNGMANSCNTLNETHHVYCKTCGYSSNAIQIGLKIIPVDRIFEYDKNWDKKYLEENTLVFGERNKNPFYKKAEQNLC